MREALDNMDGCGGVDDVIGLTSNLYLSGDYKEVKDHVVLLFHAHKSIFNAYRPTGKICVVNESGIF